LPAEIEVKISCKVAQWIYRTVEQVVPTVLAFRGTVEQGVSSPAAKATHQKCNIFKMFVKLYMICVDGRSYAHASQKFGLSWVPVRPCSFKAVTNRQKSLQNCLAHVFNCFFMSHI
jgi:hypothetical protein